MAIRQPQLQCPPLEVGTLRNVTRDVGSEIDPANFQVLPGCQRHALSRGGWRGPTRHSPSARGKVAVWTGALRGLWAVPGERGQGGGKARCRDSDTPRVLTTRSGQERQLHRLLLVNTFIMFCDYERKTYLQKIGNM